MMCSTGGLSLEALLAAALPSRFPPGRRMPSAHCHARMCMRAPNRIDTLNLDLPPEYSVLYVDISNHGHLEENRSSNLARQRHQKQHTTQRRVFKLKLHSLLQANDQAHPHWMTSISDHNYFIKIGETSYRERRSDVLRFFKRHCSYCDATSIAKRNHRFDGQQHGRVRAVDMKVVTAAAT